MVIRRPPLGLALHSGTPGQHAKSPTSCPECRPLDRSRHRDTPPVLSNPAPQTPPVSQLRRQHVRVNRKAILIDQFSDQFWPLFYNILPESHTGIETKSCNQIGHWGVWSNRFGPRSVSSGRILPFLRLVESAFGITVRSRLFGRWIGREDPWSS